MNTLQERLSYALKLRNFTQAELAKLANVSRSNIACIVTGRNKSTNAEALSRIAVALGVSLAWLAGSSDENIPKTEEIVDQVNILYYETSGNSLISSNEYKSYNQEYFIKKKIKPEECKLFKVRDDSMEPLLFQDDSVLVNCNDNNPLKYNKAHVYAFIFKEQFFIRRITPSFSNIQIQSLNSSYPCQTISEKDFKDNFKIIGRVIDKFGDGGL